MDLTAAATEHNGTHVASNMSVEAPLEPVKLIQGIRERRSKFGSRFAV